MSPGTAGGISLPTLQLQQLQFVCRAAQIPAGAIDSINVPYMARSIKVAGDRSFQDYTITVMNDEDWSLRTMFEGWQNAINSLESNIRAPGLDVENYKTNFNVRQFTKDGFVTRSYQMIGAWPTVVSPIDLDWDASNQIEVFTVTFAFDYWLPDPGDSLAVLNEYFGAAVTPATIS